MRSMRLSPTPRNMLSLVIARAVLLANVAMLSAHMPNRLSQAEHERHQQLQIEIAEHGHSHDDGFEDERHPGHHHGHDAADHSHDIPNVLAIAAIPQRAIIRSWQAGFYQLAIPNDANRLKRPPRLS